MLQEFKDFLFRGNIVELAVAFVMGVAFAAVVNSLVEQSRHADHRDDHRQAGLQRPDVHDQRRVFRYGAFITDVISFLAIAAAVFFFIVKPMNMLAARRAAPAEEGMPDEERRHQELLAALAELRR